MKYLNIVVAAIIVIFAKVSLADNFAMSVTNNTPYAISLGLSKWSETPFNFTTTEVSHHAENEQILTGKTRADGQAKIAFYMHVGSEPFSYWNTPVITYTKSSSGDFFLVQPQLFIVNGDRFTVSLNESIIDIEPASLANKAK